ncbi:MAG: SpoIID/LytB domain-containing protein [Gemmatimonadaceae bacterium]|nr:SpoIID/LytB domain-containing protein [Gemmatimonadaceae bacterium]
MVRIPRCIALAFLLGAAACSPRGPVAPFPDPSPQPQPEPQPSGAALVRIGVVQAADSVAIGGSGSFVVSECATGRILGPGSNGAAVVTSAGSGSSAGYRVRIGGSSIESVGPVCVASTTSPAVTINGQPYMGTAEVRRNSAGSLAGINAVLIEQYLYGVVPRELGPNVFPEVEAQKVQAIAARTYTVAYLGRRAADGYDLRATVDDQVYGGVAAHHPVSTAAVDATRGLVARRDGKLILARYSSTSGGHTGDNEESFAENPVAYMRGVPDMPPTAGPTFVASLEAFKTAPYITDFRKPPTPFDPDRPRYHRWVVEWTPQELSSMISTFAKRNVGLVRELKVLQRGPSGRIISLEFVTDSGSFPASMGVIRQALKYVNPAGAFVNLPSTLFFVEPVIQGGAPVPGSFRVYGGGFGHGTGMAQVGAVLMARAGKEFPEILAHYYTGVELIRAY